MHRQCIDKNKQIEYINQYYDQLRQEKLVNKKTIEDALRKQNFDYEHIQKPNTPDPPHPRSIQSDDHFAEPYTPPKRSHDLDYSNTPAQSPHTYHVDYHPSEYAPVAENHNQPEQTHYREGDYQRSCDCSQCPPRYVEKIPQLTRYQYPSHPQVNINTYRHNGDQCSTYEAPFPPYASSPSFDRTPLPVKPSIHCDGDQHGCQTNHTYHFAEKSHPCQCHLHSSMPKLKNQFDQIKTRDLRAEWLNTYATARMERKNNIKKNR